MKELFGKWAKRAIQAIPDRADGFIAESLVGGYYYDFLEKLIVAANQNALSF